MKYVEIILQILLGGGDKREVVRNNDLCEEYFSLFFEGHGAFTWLFFPSG